MAYDAAPPEPRRRIGCIAASLRSGASPGGVEPLPTPASPGALGVAGDGDPGDGVLGDGEPGVGVLGDGEPGAGVLGDGEPGVGALGCGVVGDTGLGAVGEGVVGDGVAGEPGWPAPVLPGRAGCAARISGTLRRAPGPPISIDTGAMPAEPSTPASGSAPLTGAGPPPDAG